MRIADLSPHQRPRERLMAGLGGELGDAELLALLWGSGTRGLSAIDLAQGLLAQHGGLPGLLGLGPAEWSALPGLGPAKAGQLWAAAELARRVFRGPVRPRLHTPQAAGAYLLERCRGWTEERFGLLALNARGLLLADRLLSQGTALGTLVSPREFFREALRFGAVSAIAFHNHPSGEVQPSGEDRRLTKRLREAGEMLGVPLSDHLIIGAEGFHSFRTAEGWGG
ncbi:RadC family protein [Mesoterricola silvestris]|uniref:DNA repair protein RadC n=1 Tax=Mesoterricola silvestris TaxID=2927979 RepID=A0AA48GMB0_9BACT|nr:DNA repair protein RadC [Mesoterricola silvestris]BDU72115.1 DNA repair protein RadC [Mesoterricola silvestris]